MIWTRVINNIVWEIIPDEIAKGGLDAIREIYGETFAAECREAPDHVGQRWVYNPETGEFSPPPETEVSIPSAIEDTHEMLRVALDVPMDWRGMTFTVTSEKQNLLSGQLGLFAIFNDAGAPFPLEWNETGEECTEWAFKDLLALAKAILEYVRPMANAQRYAEVRLRNAETPEQIEGILNEYRLTLEKHTANANRANN